MRSLEETEQRIEQEAGPKSPLTLFILQRKASLHRIEEDVDKVEECYVKCADIAKSAYKDPRNWFLWENNLLKFYLEADVDKACSYGQDLLGQPSIKDGIGQGDLTDLYFSVGVRFEMSLNMLDCIFTSRE